MLRTPRLSALALALTALGCATRSPPPQPPAPQPSASASPAAPPANEKLPPEEIQRVVQESFARFRECYERALHKHPKLAGRVAVGFVIELDGSTAQVEDKGSDLPDPEVIKCVLTGFSELKFPSPKGSPVKFTYPIVFSRGGDDGTTPAPAGYFAGCFVRQSPDGDVGKIAVECDQKVVTAIDMAAKLGEPMAKREMSLFEGKYPSSAKRTRATPTLNGGACFESTVDLPRGPVSLVLAPIGAHETRRLTCEERGIPGKSSPWCARALEILGQAGPVLDLLRTP